MPTARMKLFQTGPPSCSRARAGEVRGRCRVYRQEDVRRRIRRWGDAKDEVVDVLQRCVCGRGYRQPRALPRGSTQCLRETSLPACNILCPIRPTHLQKESLSKGMVSQVASSTIHHQPSTPHPHKTSITIKGHRITAPSSLDLSRHHTV